MIGAGQAGVLRRQEWLRSGVHCGRVFVAHLSQIHRLLPLQERGVPPVPLACRRPFTARPVARPVAQPMAQPHRTLAARLLLLDAAAQLRHGRPPPGTAATTRTTCCCNHASQPYGRSHR